MSYDARQTVIGKLSGYDYESITVDNTSGGVGFTVGKLTTTPRPKRVYISVETAQVRYRYDGTAPIATEGHILNPMDILTISGIHNMNNFKAIRTGATSGVLKVTYEF